MAKSKLCWLCEPITKTKVCKMCQLWKQSSIWSYYVASAGKSNLTPIFAVTVLAKALSCAWRALTHTWCCYSHGHDGFGYNQSATYLTPSKGGWAWLNPAKSHTILACQHCAHMQTRVPLETEINSTSYRLLYYHTDTIDHTTHSYVMNELI